jgi:phosphoenolpyruvate carboxykinase (GTP)
LPRIFHVNWFRQNDQGKYLWPGFGRKRAQSDHRPLPRASLCGRNHAGDGCRAEDIDLEGLDIDINDLRAMQTVENADVKAEILSQEELFLKLAGDLPKEMIFQRELLISRL